MVEEADGNHVGQVTGGGANRWDALLSQDLHFLGGYTYELTFRAKSSQPDTVIDLSMEDASYSRAFQQTNIKVGTEWGGYKYTFKFNADKDLSLKFLVGGGSFTLSLDDVEIRLAGAPAKPGAFVANGYNRATQDVIVTHTGSTEWAEKVMLTLNGEPISSELYQFADGKLVLDGSLFPVGGEYILAASAAGYADSTAAISVYPANGDLIKNGDFTNGQAYWSAYNHNGASCELDYTKGYLDARYLHAEGDSWGNMAISWSIQSNQKNIVVPAGGTYTLHFMASSEVERYIIAEFNGKKVKVLLTKEWTEHTVTFEDVKAGTYELAFLMGTVNPEDGKENFSSAEYGDNFVDFEPHNFYLDYISLIPEGSEYTKEEVIPTSIKLAGDANVTQGETAAVKAELNHPVDGEAQPTGSVAFYLNGEELHSENGELALDTSSLSEGVYTIRAVYAGDSSFGASEAEFTVTVAKKAEEPGKPEEPDTPTIPINPGRPTNPGSSGGEDIEDETDPPLAEKPFLFTDVGESNGYYDAIRWAVNNDITNGVTETLFAPNSSCTRSQIVTFLWRAAGQPEVEDVENPFTDLNPNGYYYDAVLWKGLLLRRAAGTLAVPGAPEAVGGFAFHWYTGDHFDAVRLAKDRWPDKELWFSEGCVEYSRFDGMTPLQKAEMYAHDILGNLNAGISGSLDWNLLLDAKGGPNHVGNFCEAPVMLTEDGTDFVLKTEYYYIGQFSRFIRPGAVRLGASGWTANLEVTAFENPDGGGAAVALNRTGQTLPVSVTMDGQEGFDFALAPHSIATLSWFNR